VEYTHPVLEMLRHALFFTGFSVVLVAPFLEEFHFRVLFQGWLERIRPGSPKLQLIQGDQRRQQSNDRLIEDQALLDEDRPEKERHESITPESTSQKNSPDRVPIWPLLVSALLFAVMHTGQGAAPYSLFLFAVGLGFLYRQTHSLIPCFVVHALLNLWSFSAAISKLV